MEFKIEKIKVRKQNKFIRFIRKIFGLKYQRQLVEDWKIEKEELIYNYSNEAEKRLSEILLEELNNEIKNNI